MDISLIPVCSPAVAANLDPERPETINDQVIIHYESKLDAWELWAQGVDLERFKPRGQLTVDSVFSALQAAEQGLGIAQAALPMCQARISQGNFETPFTTIISTNDSYYLVHRKSDEVRPVVQQFREWLLTEMKKL
jgi:LysR family glycine cleavage system transcriptional activator